MFVYFYVRFKLVDEDVPETELKHKSKQTQTHSKSTDILTENTHVCRISLSLNLPKLMKKIVLPRDLPCIWYPLHISIEYDFNVN